MAKYTNTERKIAILLNKSPRLKQFLKKTYQKLNYILYKKKYNHKTDFVLQVFDYQGYETFFGYYDKSPVNTSEEYIIYHSTGYATLKKPSEKEAVFIILAYFKTNKVINKYKTTAYNWQQGSKPMWISNNRFIFNDFDEVGQKYISKIVNAENGKIEKTIPCPTYDYAAGKILSLNFTRLNELRPDYGYRNIAKCNEFDYQKEGIFIADIETGDKKLLYSINDLMQIKPAENMQNAEHYVNHIMVSPNEDKVIFLHRYFKDGRRFDRLFVSNLKTNKIKLLSDHEMVSHCFWLNNNEVIAYMRRFDTGDKFYKVNVNTGEIKPVAKLENVGEDGHPHIVNGKMIYDTYPDKSRMKSLYIYDFNKETKEFIADFFESMKFYGETRCDLHPRLSPTGRYAFVDSVHTGKRQLYAIELKNEN